MFLSIKRFTSHGVLKEIYEWSFSLMFGIETLISFKVSIKFLSYNPIMYIYTKVILLNELSELSFPVYWMILSYHFHEEMSLKNVIKYFTIVLV